MSNDALTWAWRAPVKSGAKFVLVALADHGTDHSGEDWTCYPSIDRLMSRTGYSASAVKAHLVQLERDGWISRSRRRRKDGSLGVYDFVLHRERLTDAVAAAPAKRSRQAVEQAEETADQPQPDIGSGPEPDTGCGPQPDSASATARICTQPQPDSGGLIVEPSVEPSIEPSNRARGREAGDDGFDAGLAAYPLSGQARASVAEARAAWALAVDRAGSADVLIAAVQRYADWQDRQGGDYGAPAFHRWLIAENWRVWVKPAAAAPTTPTPACAAPEDLRDALGAKADEAKLASYLDPCGWDAAGKVLTARTAFAARWLRDALRGVPAAAGVVVLAPGETLSTPDVMA